MFLAVDPGSQNGKANTGWAVLDAGGQLSVCGAGPKFPILSNRKALIEKPQIYSMRHMKGDPNDLIVLAICVGEYKRDLEAAGVPVELFWPSTWKGQIDKERHHLRVDALLSATERGIVEKFGKASAKSRNDNVWDAVALAKWGWQAGRFAISQIVR